MIFLRVLAIAWISIVPALAQDGTIDESLVDRKSEEIDFPGCYQDLHKADLNKDGFVKQNEYLKFIQEYGKRICFQTDRLTLQQSATFNTLACLCRNQENASASCCIKDNARIMTDGALIPQHKQTAGQRSYLTSVCKLTDATIDGKCPPVVRSRGVPPDGLVIPDDPSGFPEWALWPIIAAALLILLLCCCCCCIWRRRRQREEENEEEEIVEENGLGEKGAPVDTDPEQPLVPAAPQDHMMDLQEQLYDNGAGPVAMGPGMGAYGEAEASDSDEEEEGRKRRGGGVIPPGEDESGIRIPTAPRLPPPAAPENPNLKLRGIPDKEHEDNEWDHPGRNIEFPKDKDEMSAGEVEHYEPDGGVYFPEREGKDPLNWKKDWNRQKPEEPDEVDQRKHRIQSGLGEGEVWNKLGEDETTDRSKQAPSGDVFDWVVQSALGALDKTDEAQDQR
jgi:hypothetical protein